MPKTPPVTPPTPFPTPYDILCQKHGVDPKTTVWRVDVASAREYPIPAFGAIFDGHLVKLCRDDRTNAPQFVSVFPGQRAPRYISLGYLLPI